MALWSVISVYSDYQCHRRRRHWPLGRRAMIARAIQTRHTFRYSIAASEPRICLVLLQLLLCQVDRALQLALCPRVCRLASTRAYLPNTQQLCRRSKSGKQRRCLLQRSPAEWFSRYSSSTPHLPRLLPPLRMRYVHVRTSNACVHGMLIQWTGFWNGIVPLMPDNPPQKNRMRCRAFSVGTCGHL